MKRKEYLLLIAIAFLLGACSAEKAMVVPTDTSSTAIPTAVSTTDGVLLELPTPIPGTVALDFSEKPCSASWSNNGEYLPCPGDINEISGGYANRFEEIVIAGRIHIMQSGLLTIPAQPESRFSAIFGKYPPFTMMDGDRFRAVLACADDYPACDVALALEYYDANGQLIQIPGATWNVFGMDDAQYIYADTDLSFFAGRTVQFSLSVRDNGNATDDFAVWILPHIARVGGAATDSIAPQQLAGAENTTVNVSGSVEMESAPSYLYDDHPPGSPAVVVFFDIDSGIWYTVSTAGTHPDFSINVPPGNYSVIAYANGLGEIPYVSGTFTGIDPSCGNSPAVLQVLAGKPVNDIKINDWNWSCGGSAARPEKPDEVSLP